MSDEIMRLVRSPDTRTGVALLYLAAIWLDIGITFTRRYYRQIPAAGLVVGGLWFGATAIFFADRGTTRFWEARFPLMLSRQGWVSEITIWAMIVAMHLAIIAIRRGWFDQRPDE